MGGGAAGKEKGENLCRRRECSRGLLPLPLAGLSFHLVGDQVPGWTP